MSRLYKIQNKIIGITGGIATGKSSFSKLLQAEGLNVICADQLVKKIYLQPETLRFIKSISKQLVSDNKIDFKSLRELFFKDRVIKEKVEGHLYPRLKSEFLNQIKSTTSVIIYDIPLLFEKNLQSKFDSVVLVYASREQQILRLCKRDQISHSLAENILKHQLPIEKKLDLSDLVIDNSKDKHHLEGEVKKKFLPLYESLQD